MGKNEDIVITEIQMLCLTRIYGSHHIPIKFSLTFKNIARFQVPYIRFQIGHTDILQHKNENLNKCYC